MNGPDARTVIVVWPDDSSCHCSRAEAERLKQQRPDVRIHDAWNAAPAVVDAVQQRQAFAWWAL